VILPQSPHLCQNGGLSVLSSASVSSDMPFKHPYIAHAFFPEHLSNHCQGLIKVFKYNDLLSFLFSKLGSEVKTDEYTSVHCINVVSVINHDYNEDIDLRSWKYSCSCLSPQNCFQVFILVCCQNSKSHSYKYSCFLISVRGLFKNLVPRILL
jgi:hypothetical protein